MVWTERKDFRARAARGMLKGWIGVIDPEQRPSDFVPGVRCYRLGRLITQGEFFGHPNSVQAPGMARLIGELEVPNVALTMNKSDFDRDSKSWIEVEQRMHKLMAPLVRRLSRDEEVPPPHSALRAAEQARRLLSQALRLVDREDAFPGIAPRERPEPGEAQRERLPLEEGEPPRPRQPAAAGRRRSGFGSIVVRPLDPSIRSQLLIEEGAALVVINSRYPLFLERKGDIWYQ